jgi:hypothetical protein
MKNSKILLLGPGHSVSQHKDEILSLKQNIKILAFQGVFPHCYTHFGLIPDYWFSADPNAWVEGFEFLSSLKPEQQKVFKNIKILIPDHSSKTYADFRMYCGTTPLGRIPGAWSKYVALINKLEDCGFSIQILPCTTTKYMALNNAGAYDIFDTDAYMRFMSEKIIFGTVPFDSESVIGDKFKWGLENKLSSHLFPLCYYMGSKEIYIVGFDFQGPRFYSDVERHPWNDETQSNNIVKYPLNIIKKWIKWENLHGMKIFNSTDGSISLLSQVLDYKGLKEII